MSKIIHHSVDSDMRDYAKSPTVIKERLDSVESSLAQNMTDLQGRGVNITSYGAKPIETNPGFDSTSAIQAAINAVGNYGVIVIPKGTFEVTSLNVPYQGLSFIGQKSGLQFSASTLKGTLNGVNIINVTAPQFSAQNLAIQGLSDTVEKGENITQNGIVLNPSAYSGNIDAVIVNVAFSYLQDCVKFYGRNVKIVNSLFSNSKRGVNIPTSQPTDSRGLEMVGCRYHSMGKLGATASACIYIDPTAQFQEVIIDSFDADDCYRFYEGFSSGTRITGMIMKARGKAFHIDSTGHTIAAERRNFKVSNTLVQTTNSSTVLEDAFYAKGSMMLDVNGLDISQAGQYGIYSEVVFARFANCNVFNASSSQHNTFDGYYIGGNASIVSNCVYRQDRYKTEANKARYGFNIIGDDVRIYGLNFESLCATAGFNRNPANEIMGNEPQVIERHETYGAAIPTTGIWRKGDIIWNTAVVAGGKVGWICTAGGTPGTWKAFGVIDA